MNQRIQLQPFWMEQMLTKCGALKLESSFQFGILMNAGLSAIGFGCYYGLLLQASKFKGMTMFKQPKEYLAVKILGRAIITVLIGLPIFVLFLVAKFSNPYL